MKLETIHEMYGGADYYDMYTGLTYKLSKLDKSNTTDIEVKVQVYQDGRLYGYATMNNPYYKG